MYTLYPPHLPTRSRWRHPDRFNISSIEISPWNTSWRPPDWFSAAASGTPSRPLTKKSEKSEKDKSLKLMPELHLRLSASFSRDSRLT